MTRVPRQRREQCTARRRDGQQCEAQAIEGGDVCRVHGGSAPQVALAARRMVLLEQAVAAGYACDKSGALSRRGELSWSQVGALGRAAKAQLALENFDRDARLVRYLQHAARQPELFPELRANLIQLARVPFSRWHGCDKVIGEQLERVVRRLELRPTS